MFPGNIGIMEKKMEATMVRLGYVGIMEKKMETIRTIWGLYMLPLQPP